MDWSGQNTHGWKQAAGTYAVVEAGPAAEVAVLARAQHILVAAVVRLLVQDPVAPCHPDGVAGAEVLEGVRAVTGALVMAALEVTAFVEDDLMGVEGHRDIGASLAVPHRQRYIVTVHYTDRLEHSTCQALGELVTACHIPKEAL